MIMKQTSLVLIVRRCLPGMASQRLTFCLPPNPNKLSENADMEMCTDLEEKVEVIDWTNVPRQADWATTPSTRFAW
jgi:hypothetical protein